MNNSHIALVNNTFTNHLSVYDRGIAFGDGFFETMKWMISNDNLPQVEFWNRHMNRIIHSCKIAKINIPSLKILNSYKCKILNKAKQKNIKEGILKLIITRGSGGRGYRFDEKMKPTIIFLSFPFQPYESSFYSKGIELKIYKNFLSKNYSLEGLKHLNRFDSVLLSNEIDKRGDFEGLVADENSNIIEGMMSNIFFIRKKILHTPNIQNIGIKGIMRQVVIEKFSYLFDKVVVENINKKRLEMFENAFITNSIMGIMPVKKIENNLYNISSIISEMNKGLKSPKFLELN